MWPTASFMGVPLRKGPASGPGRPKSGMGRLTVRTWKSCGSTSRVLSSEKPRSASAKHVRCTCSMQGEKEPRRPPAGRTRLKVCGSEEVRSERGWELWDWAGPGRWRRVGWRRRGCHCHRKLEAVMDVEAGTGSPACEWGRALTALPAAAHQAHQRSARRGLGGQRGCCTEQPWSS